MSNLASNWRILLVISTAVWLILMIYGYINTICVFKDREDRLEDITSTSSATQIWNNQFVVFTTILKNNINVWFAIVIVGTITFGLNSFLNLAYNSVAFGNLLGLSVSYNILDLFILAVLPHSIFEIPAIIIAGCAGFKIPYEIVRYLMGKKETVLTKEDIKEYFTLALISIVLIVIAAFVEAYITPKVAEYFLSK